MFPDVVVVPGQVCQWNPYLVSARLQPVIDVAAAGGVELFARVLRVRQEIAVILVSEMPVQPGQQDQPLLELHVF